VGTILASQSLADAATVTSSSFVFNGGNRLVVQCTNSTTSPPTTPCQATLQLSTDNVNWTSIETLTFGIAPSPAYIQAFNFFKYLDLSNSQNWKYFRVKFAGNTGAAVTVYAFDTEYFNVAAIPLVGTTATTGGAIASWAPPEGGPIMITETILYYTTKSTGAANASVGVAANATTSAANLIDAFAVGTTAGPVMAVNTTDKSTNGKERQLLTGVQYVTVTGSADTTGLVGTLFVRYLKP